MQELSKNALSEPEGPVAPPPAEADAEELRLELSKWQARVPKLAAALRERSEQVDKLQAQLDALSKPDPGTQARNELIAELEAKLGALNSKHQDIQGQLHSRDMEINGLRQDVADWKEKWQSVTQALDDQTSEAAGREAGLQSVKDELATVKETLKARSEAFADQDHELAMLRDEADSLGKRNAQLFETTELANRQIASLGDSLADLRDQLGSKGAELEKAKADAKVIAEQLASRTAQSQRLDADIDALHSLVETKQQAIVDIETRLAEQADAAAQSAKLEEALAQAQQQLVQRDEQVQALQRDVDAKADAVASAVAIEESLTQAQRQLAERDEQLTALLRDAQRQQAQARDHENIANERREHSAQITTLESSVTEANQEIARLEACVAGAEQVTHDREQERRELSARLKDASERVQKLESQLEERSSLVVGLEQEKIAGEQDARTLRSERENLKEQLAKSERHASEHAEHIAQLDSRLERQKELMAALEQELVQARQETSHEQKSRVRELADKDRVIAGLRKDLEARPLPDELTSVPTPARQADDAGQAAALRREVQKLERLLRDRTDEMNTLRWQQNVAENISRPGAAEAGPDSKMLVVLNQQLGEARESNERLSLKVRELEAALADGGVAVAPEGGVAATEDGDDLTAIKGIGPIVAGQLQDLGINSFLQLAQLESADLDDVAHPLNAFKGRMVKDAWIEQARERAKTARIP